MSSSPRRVAGRYRLRTSLGAGGMGRVWLADDEILHRDVAIKEILLPPELITADSDAVHRRTIREARASARVNHPNVVRIYDVIEADGRPWIVMEHVPSRSLQEVLDQDGPLEPRRVAAIGLELLAALDAAHRAEVRHRDVKPANVLLADDGRVMLTDFGIAAFDGDDFVTGSGPVLGSPDYISPERARDGTAVAASDLWSLGATLYAAVEGRPPFKRPSSVETLTALAAADPYPPQRAGALRPVLDGLLRKDPVARTDVAETRRRLEAAAAGVRVPRRRSPWGVRRSRPEPSAVATPTPDVRSRLAPPAAATPAPDVRSRLAPPAAATPAPDVRSRPEPSAVATPAPDVRSPLAPPAVATPAPDGPSRAEPPVPTPTPAPDVQRRRRRAFLVTALTVLVLALVVPIWWVAGPVPGGAAWRAPDRGPATTGVPAAATGPAGPATTPGPTDPSAAASGPTDPSAAASGPTGPSDASSPAGTGGSDPGGSGGGQEVPAAQPPAGWREYRDESGFSLYVPAGWNRTVEGTIVYFRDPKTGRVLGIDQTAKPKADPVADWRDQSAYRVRRGDFPGYREIRIVAVPFWSTAADWEFTYNGRVRQHVNNRGFVVSPTKAYGIWWQTSDADWAAARADLQLVFDSFHPAGH